MDVDGGRANDVDGPIGYWLKRLDALIEQGLDRCLDGTGMSRRHWQAVNVLTRGPVDERGVTEALRPFWGAGAATPAGVLGELAGRGWVVRDPAGRFLLTGDGEAAHRDAAGRVHTVRQRSLEGLDEAEYEAAVRVLRRMAENLAR